MLCFSKRAIKQRDFFAFPLFLQSDDLYFPQYFDTSFLKVLYVTNNLYLLDQEARTLYHEYTIYTLLSIFKIFFTLIKVVWKLEETKKYYTMYNTLHTTLELLQKEVNKSFIILSIQWVFWLLNIFDFDSFFLKSFEINNNFDLDCTPFDVLSTFGDEFFFFFLTSFLLQLD